MLAFSSPLLLLLFLVVVVLVMEVEEEVLNGGVFAIFTDAC